MINGGGVQTISWGNVEEVMDLGIPVPKMKVKRENDL